jgi:hypothetical protein
MSRFCKICSFVSIIFVFSAAQAEIGVRGLPLNDLDSWTTSFYAGKEIKVLPNNWQRTLHELVFDASLPTPTLYKTILEKFSGKHSAEENEELAKELLTQRENLRYSFEDSRTPRARMKLALLSHLAEETIVAASEGRKDLFKISINPTQNCVRKGVLAGITLCEGDVLLSKGNAGSSSFLSRISDYPGNFSHTTLAYLGKDNRVLLPEAEIEDGVKLRIPTKDYETNPKTRLYVYRLKTNEKTVDLPRTAATSFIAEMSEKLGLKDTDEQVLIEKTSYGYDSYLDALHSAKLFCSELVYRAYILANALARSLLNPYPQQLWSSITDKSVASFFTNFLGIQNLNFPAPSDIELNPNYHLLELQISRPALKNDRIDVALIDVMVAALKSNKDLSDDYLKIFKGKAEIALHAEDLQKLVAAGILPQEEMDKIIKTVPPEIGVKQIIFFAFLNKVLNKFVRDSVPADSEKIGPVKLRAMVADLIKDKLHTYAVEFRKIRESLN